MNVQCVITSAIMYRFLKSKFRLAQNAVVDKMDTIRATHNTNNTTFIIIQLSSMYHYNNEGTIMLNNE